MGGEAVTQLVRREPFAEAKIIGDGPESLVDLLAVKPVSARAHEEGGAVRIRPDGKVPLNIIVSLLVERHHPLFISLTPNSHHLLIPIPLDVGQVQTDELRCPHPSVVEEGRHRMKALSSCCIAESPRERKQARHLFSGEINRQTFWNLGGEERLGGTVVDEPLTKHPAIERLQDGQLPVDTTRGEPPFLSQELQEVLDVAWANLVEQTEMVRCLLEQPQVSRVFGDGARTEVALDPDVVAEPIDMIGDIILPEADRWSPFR
jgi:hypothetical protein